MSYSPHQTTFLPLTLSTAKAAGESQNDPPHRRGARVVHHLALSADQAASECWTALLANCDSASGKTLTAQLHTLTKATAEYAGIQWWSGHGWLHRDRVITAEARIVEAIQDNDGAEFAEAFIGYDQAVATVLVSVQNRMGNTHE